MSERSEISPARLDAVATMLGHRFVNVALLVQACTHTSRCGAQATPADKRRDANERLEFYGDALLGAALCGLLFQRFPELDEGPLSRLKSGLVSRATLVRAIEDSGLLAYCFVGLQMTQPWPDSVKANFAESILCAIHLDGGWSKLVVAVERLLGSRLQDPAAGDEDARMRLQVWCLEHHKQLPSYASERCSGSDHEPIFNATVVIANYQASGDGTSRRRAEAAAAVALMTLVLQGPTLTDAEHALGD